MDDQLSRPTEEPRSERNFALGAYPNFVQGSGRL